MDERGHWDQGQGASWMNIDTGNRGQSKLSSFGSCLMSLSMGLAVWVLLICFNVIV